MKRKTEKWESLRLEVQSFAPQEFIAACYKWQLDLLCTGGSTNGMHYVFPAEGEEAVGTVYHASHTMTYYLWTTTADAPSGQQLQDFYASIHEFNAYLADDTATNGNPNHRKFHIVGAQGEHWYEGLAWQAHAPGIDGDFHFIHADELVWTNVYSGQGNTPNAS